MKSAAPRVTVGMPIYNRAHVLRSTIDQVLAQTFSDFEFIIYNDGSKDHSAEIVRSVKDDRIIFIDKPNAGPPHPLNRILEKASGEFIIILHDHDFFDVELLAKSVAALEKYPEAGFVLQGSAWVDEDGDNLRAMLHELPEINNGADYGRQMLSETRSFNSKFHACCMVRKTAYDRIGNYDVSFGLYADTDIWLRLLSRFSFVYINEILFRFRVRETEGHFLQNKEFEIVDCNYRIHLKNLHSFFQADEIPLYEKKVLKKKNSLIVHLTIRHAANRNKLKYTEGLQLIQNEKKQLLFYRLSALVVLKKIDGGLIYSLCGFFNQARKQWATKK